MILVVCRKTFIPNVIENIFFEILLPKTTPITVSELFIGHPAKLTEVLNMTFEKVDTKKRYIYLWRFQHKLVS